MNNNTFCFSISFAQGEMLIYYSLENGHVQKYIWDSRRHCNAAYELHIVTRGRCTVDVEDTHIDLQAGQAILIAPGKYHEAHIHLREFERISFDFSLSSGQLADAMRETVAESAVFNPTADFMEYCDKLVLESMYKNPLREAAIHSLLTLLTVSLFRNLQLVKYTEPDKRKREELERKHLIDNYFEQNTSEMRGASALAEQLHLSNRQLNRVLKEYYGMGFQEKLMKKRMDHAALLLRTTDRSIPDVISLVGYNSQTAFYKAFSDQFGTSPQQYRKKNK